MNDVLETEKEEKERMQREIEELRNCPLVTATVIGGASEEQTTVPTESDVHQSERTTQVGVVVKDLSEEDRKRMDEERLKMEEQRLVMKGERESFEAERKGFIEERKKAQEDKVVLQGELVDANKESVTWQCKYEGLKEQLRDLADMRAKYEALQVQMAAVAAMATVSSEEDKQKAEAKIERAEQNRVVMEEEKDNMEADLSKWKEEFTQNNGRDPSEDDK